MTAPVTPALWRRMPWHAKARATARLDAEYRDLLRRVIEIRTIAPSGQSSDLADEAIRLRAEVALLRQRLTPPPPGPAQVGVLTEEEGHSRAIWGRNLTPDSPPPARPVSVQISAPPTTHRKAAR